MLVILRVNSVKSCLFVLLILALIGCASRPNWSGDRYVEVKPEDVQFTRSENGAQIGVALDSSVRAPTHLLRINLDRTLEVVTSADLVQRGSVLTSYSIVKSEDAFELIPEGVPRTDEYHEKFLVRFRGIAQNKDMQIELYYPSVGANRTVRVLSVKE